MSKKNALRFIAHCRGDEKARQELAEALKADWEDLRSMALAYGFACSPAELQAAFIIDFRMKWLSYEAPDSND